MAHVPTWAELRLDATKLAQQQKECYHSVHRLLDEGITELDRKLSILNHKRQEVDNNDLNHVIKSPKRTQAIPVKVVQEVRNEPRKNLTKPKQPEQIAMDAQPEMVPQVSKADKRARAQPKVSQEATICPPQIRNTAQKYGKPDLDELSHLRPLPMPISEYLKINRPEIVRRADQRTMYLKREAEKRKAERKKALTSTKITSFDRFCKNHNRTSSKLTAISREDMALEYQVEHKLSVREMKRLTARVYNRLPEVKKKRNEEITKFIKAQNYKNRQEYGRKLLENRRQGRINYPLRDSRDNSSIMMGSQDESITSDYGRSADAIMIDPHY